MNRILVGRDGVGLGTDLGGDRREAHDGLGVLDRRLGSTIGVRGKAAFELGVKLQRLLEKLVPQGLQVRAVFDVGVLAHRPMELFDGPQREVEVAFGAIAGGLDLLVGQLEVQVGLHELGVGLGLHGQHGEKPHHARECCRGYSGGGCPIRRAHRRASTRRGSCQAETGSSASQCSMSSARARTLS